MTFSVFQLLISLPKQIAIGLGCWPWRDLQGIDGESRSSFSSISGEIEKYRPSENLNEKPDSRPYYLSWPDSHFAISEYNWKDEHFIDLTRLPTQDRLVARALSDFRSKRPDYADPEVSYEETFNLEYVMKNLQQLVQEERDFQWTRREYYIVAYYSTLRPGLGQSGREKLAELDEAAFREALPSKAFIKYWFGKADHVGRNLATCLWTNRNDARRTLANGPFHRRAAREGEGLYVKGSIDIREYTLTINENVDDWSIDLLSRRIHA